MSTFSLFSVTPYSSSFSFISLFISSIACLQALICVIPPSTKIASGSAPKPVLLLSFKISTECLNLLVMTSFIHFGSSCSNTVFILKRLDKFFFITPSWRTHIPATINCPEIFEISYVSIFLGNFSIFNTSFKLSKIAVLSFSLFSSVIFALFSAISTNLNFSPFWGVFISTFLPAFWESKLLIKSLSSISSLIMILFGKNGLSM